MTQSTPSFGLAPIFDKQLAKKAGASLTWRLREALGEGVVF